MSNDREKKDAANRNKIAQVAEAAKQKKLDRELVKPPPLRPAPPPPPPKSPSEGPKRGGYER